MTPEEIRSKAVDEAAEIFRNGVGFSYLFDQMVKLAEKRLQLEEGNRTRCPTGGRHNEYEPCDVCDSKSTVPSPLPESPPECCAGCGRSGATAAPIHGFVALHWRVRGAYVCIDCYHKATPEERAR